jgi:hypothetical protein
MLNKHIPHKVVKPRTEQELKLAAKKAMLRREGKTHADRNASKRAIMAAKHISKSDRTKRALKAAKTRKSRQHLINAKISKTHKMKH